MLYGNKFKTLTVIAKIFEILGIIAFAIGAIMLFLGIVLYKSHRLGILIPTGIPLLAGGLFLVILAQSILVIIKIEENTRNNTKIARINYLINYVSMKAIASRATNIPNVTVDLMKTIEKMSINSICLKKIFC